MDTNISFFQFSCEDDKSSEVVKYLNNLPELQYENIGDDCFTLPQNKLMIPDYLKTISISFPLVDFIHTYCFTLADTMGYCVFKGGEVLHHHRESLSERVTKVRLSQINLSTDYYHFNFIYDHFEYPLSFDSSPNHKFFEGRIHKEDFKFLTQENFKLKIKEVLIFNQDDISKNNISPLVIDKAYAILNKREVEIQINYLTLGKSLNKKINKKSINRLYQKI